MFFRDMGIYPQWPEDAKNYEYAISEEDWGRHWFLEAFRVNLEFSFLYPIPISRYDNTRFTRGIILANN